MEKDIFTIESKHLNITVNKLQQAKVELEKSLQQMGSENLEKLKELRSDPQTEPHDLLMYMEQIHEKNIAFNFKDKYKRLEEFDQLLNEPYFSRIDMEVPETGAKESWYIGKYGFTEEKPVIIDWRAKVASVYYRYRYPQKNVTYDTPDGTQTRNLQLKRTFEVEKGELIKYYNNDIQLDENEIIVDKIEKRTGGVLEDIVETIQESQLDIIEADPRQVCIVQGSVGSGKSTVAIHKLSHIFFNYPALIHPEKSILLAKNQILVGYLSTLFPKLGIFDINSKTLRDLVYNVVFREELNFKTDFDMEDFVEDHSFEWINRINEKIGEIHTKTREDVETLFEDPDFSIFAGFKYSENQTMYENVSEAIEEMEDELDMQKHYLKESGDRSLRAALHRDNIKILKRLVSRLKKMRMRLKESTMTDLVKSEKLPVTRVMSYTDTLKYLYIYSQIVGFQNTFKYEYCVVDEGQDFSVLEYLVLGKLVHRGRFCILGDLNQSYVKEGLTSWDLISEAITEAKTANVYELDTNYRSTKPIIDFANSILSTYTEKYLPKSINRIGPDPSVNSYGSKEEMMSALESELRHDAGELGKSIGIISYNNTYMDEIATLARSLDLPEEEVIVLESNKKIHYIPKGVYVTNFDNCKGLEFSKVIVVGLDLSKVNSFSDAKKAFVAVTRAMNELSLYSHQ
jgi:DNA helicase II / ATP-dependent DNA helicase PcrA